MQGSSPEGKHGVISIRPSVGPSVLPCEAIQGLFEVLLGSPRPSGPSEGLLLGLLKFPGQKEEIHWFKDKITI